MLKIPKSFHCKQQYFLCGSILSVAHKHWFLGEGQAVKLVSLMNLHFTTLLIRRLATHCLLLHVGVELSSYYYNCLPQNRIFMHYMWPNLRKWFLSYSLSNCIYLTVHCVTCEHGTNLKIVHLTLLTGFYS